MNQIRQEIIRESIAKMRQLGLQVTSESLFQDEVYRAFFHALLLRRKNGNREQDIVIDELIIEINKQTKK
jgi:hypothetical protein